MTLNRSRYGAGMIRRMLPLTLFVIVGLALLAIVSSGAPVWAKPMLQPTEFPIITGTVNLQGRPSPPAASWAIPLDVELLCSTSTLPGLYPYSVTTDQYGEFSFTHVVSQTSTCDISVKNAHTLQNTKYGVTINAGGNVLSFGTLHEGDANDDNRVSLVDFSILATSYDLGSADPGFDARADFNENDWIEIADFSLLATNYDQSGDIPVAASRAAGDEPVTLSLEPSRLAVPIGHIFTVDIRLDPRGQPFQGVATFLQFDADELEVVDELGNPAAQITSAGVLPTELTNQVDNAAGIIKYSAGVLGTDSPSEALTLATIRFKAKQLNLDGSPVQFVVQDYPPRTNVAMEGAYLPLEVVDLNMRIAHKLLRLPALIKQPIPITVDSPAAK
jgi:hypothetical protein